VILPQLEASSKLRFRSRQVIEKMVPLTSSWNHIARWLRTLCRIDAIRRIETCASILKTRAARYSERGDRWVVAGLWSEEIQQHHIRALLHPFEDNFTTVWEVSKSRMSNSGVRLVSQGAVSHGMVRPSRPPDWSARLGDGKTQHSTASRGTATILRIAV